MTIPKFRAYIKEIKQTYQVMVIDYIERNITVIPHPSYNIGSYGIEKKYMFDEIELMQYTGQKDINGLDIYKREK